LPASWRFLSIKTAKIAAIITTPTIIAYVTVEVVGTEFALCGDVAVGYCCVVEAEGEAVGVLEVVSDEDSTSRE